MPHIKSITTYPIKSCAGIALEHCAVLPDGLKLDREWMLIDAEGHFLSQRQASELALVKPSVSADGQGLIVSAVGMQDHALPDASVLAASGKRYAVRLWRDDVRVIDAGEQTAQWFSDFLGVKSRLVRFDETAERTVDENWTVERSTTRLTDGFPFLFIGQSSLDDLNSRLASRGVASVEMSRFRPNVVVEGWEPFEEDYIESVSITTERGSDLVFRLCKPCTRCVVTTIDQATGKRRTSSPYEPLDTLSSFRRSPRMEGGIVFGQNAVVCAGAGCELQVGREVAAELAFPDP
ncbi:MOSC domain-containing protein [Paraburkholderia fungorum]|uniref:MOSC domain-containing protein n=1 Tax=Paraburkholderia fungorum TaxID=134537 RepID=UPI0004898CF4|nr:MOSC N-terminal beta barrel domain-containing protein [Paraburkholderia fungorum]PNE59680.1 MOSC domain-containing protein [Paraburkholderia fungorum]